MYIGKTYLTIEQRFKEHIKDSKRKRSCKRPLYNAFNKYGVENFLVFKLNEFEENILEEREIYYIELFNTYKDGYNATLGGDTKKLYNFTKEQIQQAINETDSLSKSAKFLNIDNKTLKKFANSYNIKLKLRTKNRKKVYVEELDQVFESTTSFLKSIGVDGSSPSGEQKLKINGKRQMNFFNH